MSTYINRRLPTIVLSIINIVLAALEQGSIFHKASPHRTSPDKHRQEVKHMIFQNRGRRCKSMSCYPGRFQITRP
ncbi:hypothetical protein F5B18DRAFT_238778 [Nemania serpens]|nr:hypothetical protein F5B18DRAFT_238778 [Nemania serpens]